MDYEKQMQTLITKTTIDIVIILSLIAIIIAIVWIVPFVHYRKTKNIASKIKRTAFIAKIALTAICLLFSLTTISGFRDISNMKKDIATHDFVTFTGDYSIDVSMRLTFSVSELWYDLQTVTIENSDEPLWFDMMSDNDADLRGTGTIVYGRNSRYVVMLESK